VAGSAGELRLTGRFPLGDGATQPLAVALALALALTLTFAEPITVPVAVRVTQSLTESLARTASCTRLDDAGHLPLHLHRLCRHACRRLQRLY
jgi:hypothetical protein